MIFAKLKTHEIKTTVLFYFGTWHCHVTSFVEIGICHNLLYSFRYTRTSIKKVNDTGDNFEGENN